MQDLYLLAVVGSLRTASVNAATARAAVAQRPEHVTISIYDVSDLPFYHGDVEAVGLPDSVRALHDAVGAADGLLFFSPEYNSSFPAVTKNTIDWLTRPPRSWEGTPVGLVVTTPGRRAGQSLRDHFTVTMAHQPIRLFETLGIGSYRDKLDADGELVDADALHELAGYLQRFADFCRSDPQDL